jgi:hypothetical protein
MDRSALALLHAHAYDDPIPLQDVAHDVPDAIADVTMRALCRDRNRRYQSAEQLGAELAEASNRVWDAGWVGRHHLVVVPTGQIARNLSLPPKLRDPAADEKPHTRVSPAAMSAPAPITPVPTPAPAPVDPNPQPAPGWWIASDGRWYPPHTRPASHAVAPQKSKTTAALLAFFLGAFGAHRFYLGYTGVGTTMLLITVLSAFLLSPFVILWGWVEFLVILTDNMRTKQGTPLR